MNKIEIYMLNKGIVLHFGNNEFNPHNRREVGQESGNFQQFIIVEQVPGPA